MIGKVEVWHLTPEQMAAYQPGMDLGEPDEIREPTNLIVTPMGQNAVDYAKGKTERAVRAMLSRRQGKPLITPAEYRRMRDSGQSRKEIAEAYGIQYQTLLQYISMWKSAGKL